MAPDWQQDRKDVLYQILPPNFYEEKNIYMKLLNKKLNADRLFEKVAAQRILKDLRTHPNTNEEFIAKFEHCNQIEWAEVKQEAYQNFFKKCKIRYMKAQKDSYTFKLFVNKEFIETNQLREGSLLKLYLIASSNLWRSSERIGQHFGNVYDIVEENSTLIVKFSTLYERPDESYLYDVVALPSPMVFNSRCRTLELMRLNTEKWHYCVFPTSRNLISKQCLISMEKFEQHERQFLASTSFDNQRSFNDKQKSAIHAIVSGLHGKVPYILFGPPGTGKTVTLVEAVRLLYVTNPKARVLVCTPSNTAADAFMLALMATESFTKGSTLRVFSMSKRVREQNVQLFDENKDVLYILHTQNGLQFNVPSIQTLLKKKRVLVCTLNTSTYLINGGLQHCFSHIIIDEAGQASELEALIPIVGLTTDSRTIQKISYKAPKVVPEHPPLDTRIVFAGDPKQLGPVQKCDPLRKVTKYSSLVERLIKGSREEGPNDDFNFDKRVTIMLENNYRSHPKLLSISSQLYYGGKLQPSAPIEQKSTLCQWNRLPKKGFPMLWHSVIANEECDAETRSYRNLAECDVVSDYVDVLTKEAGVCSKDIGIITPYRTQIKLLRATFAKRHPAMLIDSVERFQGCERRVIIVSTVRSLKLGFLDCDKRFNTAITRPMELLIVVGDSKNMAKVGCWKRLITYCEQNDAVIGDIGGQPSSLPFVIQKKKSGAKFKTKKTAKAAANYRDVSSLANEVGELALQLEQQIKTAKAAKSSNYRDDDDVNSLANDIGELELRCKPLTQNGLLYRTNMKNGKKKEEAEEETEKQAKTGENAAAAVVSKKLAKKQKKADEMLLFNEKAPQNSPLLYRVEVAEEFEPELEMLQKEMSKLKMTSSAVKTDDEDDDDDEIRLL